MVTTVTGSSSPLPAIGMLLGMVLLGFAGVIVVMPSTSAGPQQSHEFLGRRLQGYGIGYITTSKAPSSFDSSDSSSSSDYSSEPSKSSMSGSMQSSDWNEVWPKVAKALGGSCGWITISLLIQVTFAMLYYRIVTAPIVDSGKLTERDLPPGEMKGIFQCTSDRWVCIQGLCCPMVRVAHTNAVSGICPFWESLWCWCCCAWMTLNIGPFCLLMWWRMQIKGIMKLEDNPIEDFCITMVCPQLSICQLSSAVDNAAGYQITGCCEYTPYGYDS
jgi:Cys-rich protein (TIGR01571 family)